MTLTLRIPAFFLFAAACVLVLGCTNELPAESEEEGATGGATGGETGGATGGGATGGGGTVCGPNSTLVDACVGPVDTLWVASDSPDHDLDELLQSCLVQCGEDHPDLATCIKQCAAGEPAEGLSPPCAQCHGCTLACMTFCGEGCVNAIFDADAYSQCVQCVEDVCLPDHFVCSGHQ